MPEIRRCPQCQAQLPPDAPDGICPQCVLGLGFGGRSAGHAGPRPDATGTESMARAAGVDPRPPDRDDAVHASGPVRPARSRRSLPAISRSSRSWSCWARAAWGRFTRLASGGWTGWSRSRSCPRRSPGTRRLPSDSPARPGRSRGSITRTSSRCTTSARPAGCTTSSWSSSTA